MIDIESYIGQLINLLEQHFPNRLLYVGLQGSYLRAEAKENSDIDIMVILDTLCVSDLDIYRAVIRSLDYSDKSCGFICSREDLANWNPLEIWNLVNGTKDYFGNLSDYVPSYDRKDIVNYVKVSLNNLYHAACHGYIHGSLKGNNETLLGLYKGTFFVLQTMYYLDHEKYIGTKNELLPLLTGVNREVLLRTLELECGQNCLFDESFSLLLNWCQQSMRKKF